MSSFKGRNIFGSGPHRFAQLKQGQGTLPALYFKVISPATTPIGKVELDVVVKGRLVAASDAALWALRDAVTAELEDPPTPGTLVSNDGRSWEQMTFLSYVEADRTDRGRIRSIGYTATFRAFASFTFSASDLAVVGLVGGGS